MDRSDDSVEVWSGSAAPSADEDVEVWSGSAAPSVQAQPVVAAFKPVVKKVVRKKKKVRNLLLLFSFGLRVIRVSEMRNQMHHGWQNAKYRKRKVLYL